MSFSKIIKDSFVLIAKELSKLEHSKLSGSFEDRKGKSVKTPEEYKHGIFVELHGAKDINIKGQDEGNFILITIKESSDKNTSVVAHQMTISHSGKAFIRSSYVKSKGKSSWIAWRSWGRIITDDEPALSMIHAISDSVNKKSTLKINGNVRIEDLVKQDLEKSEKLETLRPLVSNEQGDIFSLPYGRNKAEDHFVIPIVRSGWKSLVKDEEMRIENLFDPYGNWHDIKKSLIEIKLLLNHKTSEDSVTHGAAIIYFINNKLHSAHVLGGVNQVEQKNDELLNFRDNDLTLEIVQNQNNEEDRDALIKYSGKYQNNIRYFITRYSTT